MTSNRTLCHNTQRTWVQSLPEEITTTSLATQFPIKGLHCFGHGYWYCNIYTYFSELFHYILVVFMSKYKDFWYLYKLYISSRRRHLKKRDQNGQIGSWRVRFANKEQRSLRSMSQGDNHDLVNFWPWRAFGRFLIKKEYLADYDKETFTTRWQSIGHNVVVNLWQFFLLYKGWIRRP